MKLTEWYLQSVYKPKSGWKYTRKGHLNGVPITHVLNKGQMAVVVCSVMQEPYVASKHICTAKELINFYASQDNDTYVEVVLVYDHLLFAPQDLPKDIEVISLSENNEVPLKNRIYEYCPN